VNICRTCVIFWFGQLCLFHGVTACYSALVQILVFCQLFSLFPELAQACDILFGRFSVNLARSKGYILMDLKKFFISVEIYCTSSFPPQLNLWSVEHPLFHPLRQQYRRVLILLVSDSSAIPEAMWYCSKCLIHFGQSSRLGVAEVKLLSSQLTFHLLTLDWPITIQLK